MLSRIRVVWPLGDLIYTWNLRYEAREKGYWASLYVSPCNFSNTKSMKGSNVHKNKYEGKMLIFVVNRRCFSLCNGMEFYEHKVNARLWYTWSRQRRENFACHCKTITFSHFVMTCHCKAYTKINYLSRQIFVSLWQNKNVDHHC